MAYLHPPENSKILFLASGAAEEIFPGKKLCISMCICVDTMCAWTYTCGHTVVYVGTHMFTFILRARVFCISISVCVTYMCVMHVHLCIYESGFSLLHAYMGIV